MINVLNLYLIHSLELTNRQKYINSTIEMIKNIAVNNGLEVKINVIKQPTKEFINDNVENFNKHVQYEKETGEYADEQFNNIITNLNVQQISNIEKHKQAYYCIDNPEELHFIIEDDVLVGEDYIKNLEELFRNLRNKSFDWDILFTCIANLDGSTELKLIDSRIQYKFLLSKSSYFICPEVSKKLLNYLNVYKYNLKNGISKFIWDNKDIKSFVLNKHTFLEGTKMGLFPTSVNNTNFLFQNVNFVNLTKITNSNNITDNLVKDAENIYSSVSRLENPDILHCMGIIYYKNKDYTKAKKFLCDACEKLSLQKGLITKSSDILNNAINMFQHEQNLLDYCKNKKSKYLG